jgi:phosphatidylglycerol:prolipoprotein diacylglycerol transferase
MDELLAAFTYTPQQRWGPVSPHGVGTALGFFLGAWLMAKRAEPRGIPRPEVYNAVTWGAVGAIIGARGFYILAHLDSYTSVVDALKVWEGGLTMFGGFIGGLVLGLGYLRRKRFSILTAMDAAAPGFVVGVLIGRLGDIAIADHLGERTSFFLGYKIPNAPLAPGYGPPYYTPGTVVHHTAVYDLVGALVLLGFVYWLEKRRPRTGTLFAAFSIWYGLQRFAIDFTRNRLVIESSYFGLSGSQWAGLGFAVFGIFLLLRIRRRALGAEPAPEAVPAVFASPLPPTEATHVGETPWSQPADTEASAAPEPQPAQAAPPSEAAPIEPPPSAPSYEPVSAERPADDPAGPPAAPTYEPVSPAEPEPSPPPSPAEPEPSSPAPPVVPPSSERATEADVAEERPEPRSEPPAPTS